MDFEKTYSTAVPLLTAALDRRTRIRLRTTALAGADCALNVLILHAFAHLGTIGHEVPLKMLFLATALNLTFIVAIASGISKRFRDPAMTWMQILSGCAVNLIALATAPQIAYMFIVNLFVTLSFGSLYFRPRQFVLAWMILSLALGATLLLVGDDVGMARETRAEKLLFWFVLMLALGRFLVINAEISRLRSRLYDRNRELAGATSRLAELASRDMLTGLLNRREFMRHLHNEFRRSERNGSPFWLAIIDADHFRHVNDAYGHQAGDQVLQALAAILERSRRTTDAAARYEGEEFMLLLIDPTPEGVSASLERLRASIEKHDWQNIIPGMRVTVSIGAAGWRPGETLNQLLNRADAALREAKHAGRNRLSISRM